MLLSLLIVMSLVRAFSLCPIGCCGALHVKFTAPLQRISPGRLLKHILYKTNNASWEGEVNTPLSLFRHESPAELLRSKSPLPGSPQATSRLFSVETAEYAKGNYANNISEYNTVIGSFIAQRRNFLLRDVYDDVMLDGVQPVRDTFHSLIVGCMKGSQIQDAFFFRDEMKAMGLPPDVNLYNFLISTCGKCKNSDAAIKLLEEMKRHGVKLKGETYICLLNACAATGRTDQVYAIVRDMTAAGLGLNKFCYAGLITAFKNKLPITE